MSKYKTIFAKGYTTNQSEAFVIKKVKNTVPWVFVISDLNEEEIVRTFDRKELPKKHKLKKSLIRKNNQEKR